jgi:hypothetical protein
MCESLNAHEHDGACYWITSSIFNIDNGAAHCGFYGGNPARVIKASHRLFLSDMLELVNFINNGVSIVQKLVVKLSNTSTMLFSPVEVFESLTTMKDGHTVV